MLATLKCFHQPIQCFSYISGKFQQRKAVILGVYTKENNEHFEGTKTFAGYDKLTNGKLTDLIKSTKAIQTGSSKVFCTTDEDPIVSVVSFGDKKTQNHNEGIDLISENIRKGIAAGIRSLKDLGIERVEIDVADNAAAVAEGAFLSSWCYKELERENYPRVIEPITSLNNEKKLLHRNNVTQDWEKGKIYAEGQNFARYLAESPANLMTPTIFSQVVKEKLKFLKITGNIEIKIHNRNWIEKQKMGAFLSVTKGSSEPPKFLEIHYSGPDNGGVKPFVFVGKGITFDCGGISIKQSNGMEEMRGDIGGAAAVVSAIYTAAKLNMPGKIIGLIPLCENLINGRANKPGDVVTARNGTTIQIDNTDAEGRLILADTLCYANDFNPSGIIDVATLTFAIRVALGAGASGVFSNCDNIWKKLSNAGYVTGDRMWRMPLYQLYMNEMKPAHLADINNMGKGAAGPCTAAAFLNHFVEKGTDWAHIDILGVLSNDKLEVPYIGKGMSGRPTRTLAEFMQKL